MRGNAHNIVGHKWRWKVVRTGDPILLSVPDNTNRTIHDDHVRQPPIHRTPKRAAQKKPSKSLTTKKRLQAKKPLMRSSAKSTKATRRTSLTRKKPMGRRPGRAKPR
jgi:hypothetical protein